MEFIVDTLLETPVAVLYFFDNLSSRESTRIQYTVEVQFLILDSISENVDFFEILKMKGETKLISLPISNLGQFKIGDVFEKGVLVDNCMPNKPLNKRKVVGLDLSKEIQWNLKDYLTTRFTYLKNRTLIDESFANSNIIVFKDKNETEYVVPLCVVMKHFYMFNSYITRIYFQTGIKTEKGIYTIIEKSETDKSLTFKLDKKLENGWASIVARSILMSGLRKEFSDFFNRYNSQLVNDTRLKIPIDLRWPKNEGTGEISFSGIEKKIKGNRYFFVFAIDQTIGEFELGEYNITLVKEVKTPSTKPKDPNKPDRIIKIGDPDDKDITNVNQDFNPDKIPLPTDTPNAVDVSGFPAINMEYVIIEKDPGGTTVISDEPTHNGTGQEDKDSEGRGTVENLEDEVKEDEESDGSINFHYLYDRILTELQNCLMKTVPRKQVFS